MNNVDPITSDRSKTPLGPVVDATPRPLPSRSVCAANTWSWSRCTIAHAAELWDAARGADESWAYLAYGPFADQQAMARHVASFASQHDPIAWAIRP